MPKFISNYNDSIINICREDAHELSCEKCAATVQECVENLQEARKIWDDINVLKEAMKNDSN